jgi:peptidoglycan hydrolase-like protein with peptidoglycan-binding domain
MAVITQTIQAGEQNNAVTEVQQALISLGATIATAERATATVAGTFGPSTQAAATALLARFGSQPPNPFAFNAMAGRLLNIAAGAESGNSAGLRQAVRESYAVIQTPPIAGPSELAWLARYAVIGQDFTTARQIAAQIPDEPVIKEKIGPIVNLTTLQPAAPELVNPENYYTVVYDYVSRPEVQKLLQETS